MNWLVFYTEKDKTEIKSIEDFFAKRSIDLQMICLSVSLLKSIDNVADIQQTHPECSELHQAVQSATHAVILLSDEMEKSLIVNYYLGFFEGKHVDVFVVGAFSSLFCQLRTGFFKQYKVLSALLDFLDSNLGLLKIADERKNAYRELYDSGVPFNPDNFSFHIAKGNSAECDLFLKAGMDVNSRDSAGTPMTCIAARNDQKEMLSWLVDNGADIDAVSKDRGYSAVMDAVWKMNFNIVQHLIDCGANLNFISRDGQSLLVLAVGSENNHISELLIKHGANPFVKDHLGMSAYDYAKLFKKEGLVKMIDEIYNAKNN